MRDDKREAKAHIAVLVAANPPADIETFVNRDGVWIVRRRYARDLASLLRHIFIAVYAERANQAGKDEKMEILYGYLISPEFQHRVQAIVEGFTAQWPMRRPSPNTVHFTSTTAVVKSIRTVGCDARGRSG